MVLKPILKRSKKRRRKSSKRPRKNVHFRSPLVSRKYSHKKSSNKFVVRRTPYTKMKSRVKSRVKSKLKISPKISPKIKIKPSIIQINNIIHIKNKNKIKSSKNKIKNKLKQTSPDNKNYLKNSIRIRKSRKMSPKKKSRK
jgi:hypothetical protein